MVERGRPPMTVWGTLIARWIPEGTNTQVVQYVFFYALEHWLNATALLLRYTYMACLVLSWLSLVTIPYLVLLNLLATDFFFKF